MGGARERKEREEKERERRETYRKRAKVEKHVLKYVLTITKLDGIWKEFFLKNFT